MKIPVALVAALIAGCACAGAGGPGGPAPSATTVLITQDANGKTVDASVGDTVQVTLGPDLEWKVTVSDSAVLEPQAGIPLPSGTQGRYRAARAGTTTVNGEGRPRCAPGQICAQFIVAFQAKVEVR